ncbi:hypothetical protein FJTKL_10149 [Diaporthe vaccinii]|uniref:Uncharacterized protein n=1 Tax=Diaporthe vaccinii TaxID=105482 RepID=A0ABR4EKQ4_9PEZI
MASNQCLAQERYRAPKAKTKQNDQKGYPVSKSAAAAILHPPWYHRSTGYPSLAFSLSVPLKRSVSSLLPIQSRRIISYTHKLRRLR